MLHCQRVYSWGSWYNNINTTGLLGVVGNEMVELGSILLLIVILWVIVSINKRKHRNRIDHEDIVRKSSLRYNRILTLNQQYEFVNIAAQDIHLRFHDELKSKREFDLYEFEHNLQKMKDEDSPRIKQLKLVLQDLHNNSILYNAYASELKRLPKYADSRSVRHVTFSTKKYERIERMLCEQAILEKPFTELQFRHSIQYVSPKGRNRYNDHRMWRLNDFMEYIDPLVHFDGKWVNQSQIDVYQKRETQKKNRKRQRAIQIDQKRIDDERRRQERIKKKAYVNERDKVKDLSLRYNALIGILENYQFVDIKQEDVDIILHEHFDTRSKVDNYVFDLNDFMRYVYDNKSDLAEQVYKINVNREIAEDYYQEIVDLPIYGKNHSRMDTKLSYEEYVNVEKILCEKLVLKNPVTDMNILYYVTYRSPKGQSELQKTKRYSFEQIEIALGNVDAYKKARDKGRSFEHNKSNFVREQRTIAAGLRYDVLTRDGHRCQICGVKALDGEDIVLHVDHIKPVSKGGLSTMDNLRTLCQTCNIGKSAKYNPNGIN